MVPCEPVNEPGFRAIVCGGRGMGKSLNADLEILRDMAADLKACREAGHGFGTAAGVNAACPRCRRELGLPAKEPAPT